MNDHLPIAEVMRQLSAMSPQQRAEKLLVYFSRLIDSMDRQTLNGFRQQCVNGLRASPQKEDLLQLIDGNIALREIRELPTEE